MAPAVIYQILSVLRIRIRDQVPFWLPDLGSGMSKSSGFGTRIRKNKFWVKILHFFDADPGYGMEKIRIRDKHPGSATLDFI